MKLEHALPVAMIKLQCALKLRLVIRFLVSAISIKF